MMYYEDAVLKTTTSRQTACLKISEVSAKKFTRQAYSFSRKGGGGECIDKEGNLVRK
jgi:hypothetical protein